MTLISHNIKLGKADFESWIFNYADSLGLSQLLMISILRNWSLFPLTVDLIGVRL